VAVSEPFPTPISQMPAAGSDAHHPFPVDTDFLPGIVWDANKKGPGVGGWTAVKVSYGDIFNLPINTAGAIGLIDQVEASKAGAFVAMGQAQKYSLSVKNILTQVQAALAATLSAMGAALQAMRKARTSAALADQGAARASAMASMVQSKLNAARRQFSDSNVVGLSQSMLGPRVQPKVRQPNNANDILANQIFGS
jgi:hypothetical protein